MPEGLLARCLRTCSGRSIGLSNVKACANQGKGHRHLVLCYYILCFSLETLAALTCQVKTVKRTKCTRVRTVHGALRVERHRPPGLPVSSRKRQKHRDVQQALKPGFLERSLSELLVHKSLLLQLLKQETWHSSMISSSLLHMKDLQFVAEPSSPTGQLGSAPCCTGHHR